MKEIQVEEFCWKQDRLYIGVVVRSRDWSQKTQAQMPATPLTSQPEPSMKSTIRDGLRGLLTLHIVIFNIYHTENRHITSG